MCVFGKCEGWFFQISMFVGIVRIHGNIDRSLSVMKVMAVCNAAYEATGSQVQFALERGLPAMIGNFILRQLPYPSLSSDIVHCAQCGIVWDEKGTLKLN